MLHVALDGSWTVVLVDLVLLLLSLPSYPSHHRGQIVKVQNTMSDDQFVDDEIL